MTLDPAAVRAWLQEWQFWYLEAQLWVVVVLSCFAFPALIRLQPLSRAALVAMVCVSTLMLTLIVGVVPRTNRIYYDEHIYQGVAQNLSDLRRAQICNDGHVEYGRLQCARTEYNKEPYGYPHLIGLGYRIAGVSEAVAYWINVFCTVALAWIVFLTTMLLFGEARAAVFAALVLALTPQQLLWAGSAAAEPAAALFSAFAVLTVVFHVRTRSTLSLWWMTAALVFAMQFRMEVILLAPVAVVVFLLYAPRELLARRTWIAALAGVALGSGHLLHLASVRAESWGAPGDRFSLDYFWPNLAVNGHYYLGDPRFPVLFSLLAIAGLVHKPGRAAAVPFVSFVLFWGIFVFFYAGSYNFGADVRFSLMSHAWLAMLAGRGSRLAVSLAAAVAKSQDRAVAGVTAALLIQFSWYLPQVRAVGEEAWAARADVEFARRVIPTLPSNAIVLTHNPSIFHLNGVNAAQMSLVASEPSYVTGSLAHRYAGGVFLHWNAWCGYTDPQQQAFCESVLASFDSELVAEHRERDFRYGFYRLKTDGTVPKVAP